jgi:diguanylate cyclase (GGDEF)-like protein
MSRFRGRLLPAIAVTVLTLIACAVISELVAHADSSRRDQLQTTSLKVAVKDLQAAPFNANVSSVGSPAAILREIRSDESTLSRGLSSALSPSPSLQASGRAQLAEFEQTAMTAYRLFSSLSGATLAQQERVPRLWARLALRSHGLFALLDHVGQADARAAAHARLEAQLGTVVALLLLLIVFLLFYFRLLKARTHVARLARHNESMLKVSQAEAATDALTGLGNRRAFDIQLSRSLGEATDDSEVLVAMFDLDGFKQYNDSYGHAAGDALLERLSVNLAAVLTPPASAYRMGGDEFCVVSQCSPADAERLLSVTAAALAEDGDGWKIGCSYGAAWIPSEAATESDALRLADQRMYASKRSRASASRQLTDVLLQVISEQGVRLDEHVERVARMSASVATTLGQPEHEVQRIRLAATLHDVGKAALPTEILNKATALTPHEWEFVRRHTIIGERIVSAAPALASAAPLVRSSHERIDGKGYPDGLCADQIPIGSKIIAVCDAFDAMTSDRPYRRAVTVDAALDELRRCQGTQFDSNVVEAFDRLLHQEHADVALGAGDWA